MEDEELREFLSQPYQYLNKETLLDYYEGFFGKKLKRNCNQCYRRAYNEFLTYFNLDIFTMAKSKKVASIIDESQVTPTDEIVVSESTPVVSKVSAEGKKKGNKYTYNESFKGSTTFVKEKGWVIKDSITDEQGDYIIKNLPSLKGLIKINE